jgi:ankyrin repeat protein
MVVFGSAAPLQAEISLPRDAVARINAAVFEVVVPKEEDPLSYARELPVHLLPYSVRTDDYRPVGTAFMTGDNRFISAAHVFMLHKELYRKGYYLRDMKGDVYPVDTVYGYSSRRDLVTFSVKQPPEAEPLSFDRDPEINESVYAVGNAHGQGIIMRDGTLTSQTAENLKGEWKWLRFSAAASPGNSGGPLVNNSGEVLGVVTAKSPSENLNYAYPASEISPDVPGIKGGEIEDLFSYGLPVAEWTVQEVRQGTVELPAPWRKAAERLQGLYRRFLREMQQEYYREYGERLFPNGPGSHPLLTRNKYQHVPVLYGLNKQDNWFPLEPEAEENVDLKGDARLDYAELGQNLTLIRLREAGGGVPNRYMANPAEALERVLEGYPYRRSVGNQNIAITGFGEPAAVQTHRDRYGRVWAEAEWKVPFADVTLMLNVLPTPMGFAGFMSLNSSARITETRLLYRDLYRFFNVGFSATLRAWKSYMEMEEYLPACFRGSEISFSEEKEFRFTTDELSFGFTSEHFMHIHPHSSFETWMGFELKQGEVRWGPEYYLFTGTNIEDDDIVGLEKFSQIPEGAADENREKRARFLKGEEVCTGEWEFEEDYVHTFGVFGGEEARREAREENLPFYTIYLKTGENDNRYFPATLREVFKTGTAVLDPAIAGYEEDFHLHRDLTKIEGMTIFEAVSSRNHELLSRFIDQKTDLEARDHRMRTPLMAATVEKDEAAASMLLDAGVNIHVQQEHGETLFMSALANTSVSLAERVFEMGPDLTARTNTGWTPLMYAMKYDKEALVPVIYAAGGAPEGRSADNVGHLIKALQCGYPEIARELIQSGVEINYHSKPGFTPLHYAFRNEHWSIARLLIEHGADISARSSGGWTALHYAANTSQLDLCRLILKKGADVRAKANDGFTPLMAAANEAISDITKLLIERGARINARDEDGRTALHRAVSSGRPRQARYLLEAGADPQAESDEGKTPFILAAEEGDLQMQELLQEYW